MTVYKQSVSFTDTAYAFAKELVERGEYPNVSAAVSGELVRAKAARDRNAALLEAEVQRRLTLPLDHWEPLSSHEALTTGTRSQVSGAKEQIIDAASALER